MAISFGECVAISRLNSASTVEFVWPDCDRWIALTQETKWDRFQDRFYFSAIRKLLINCLYLERSSASPGHHISPDKLKKRKENSQLRLCWDHLWDRFRDRFVEIERHVVSFGQAAVIASGEVA